MGIGPFQSTSAKQQTTNQQVGIQGTGNVGLSGSVKGAQAGGGSTAIGSIYAGAGRGGQAGNVSIALTDLDAIHSAERIAVQSLASNNSLSVSAINAANDVGIRALQLLGENQRSASELANMAVSRSQDIAETAAPVSTAKTLVQNLTEKPWVILGLAALGVGAIYLWHRGFKL